MSPLFLISGGASSLVEVLEPGVSLAQLEQLSARALAEGVAIAELNARRARLSRIKGGRLAAQLAGRAARALFISDVPDDDPAVIGSGLLGPAAAGPDRIERQVIASVDEAMEGVVAAASAARAHCGVCARRGLRERRRASPRASPTSSSLATRRSGSGAASRRCVCRRSRGVEDAISISRSPPAKLLADYPDLALLAAGTDGTDGPTEAAGGLVDADTCGRLALAGLDADDCLARADAGTALAAAGALVSTGPTGTNVADLVIGLKLPRAGT